MLVALLSGAAPVAARSLDDIVASGAIDICVQEDNMPFSDQATRKGILLDVGKIVADALHVRLSETWLVSAEYVRKTGCDLVPAVAAIPSDDPIKLTIPYMRVRTTVVTQKTARALTRLADLENDKIAVLADSYARHVLTQQGAKLSVAFLENEDILAAVDKGEDAAGVVTLPSFDWYMHRKNAALRANFDLLGETYDYDAAIGLRKADARLVEAINQALRSAIADGTMKTIFARYGLGYVAPRS